MALGWPQVYRGLLAQPQVELVLGEGCRHPSGNAAAEIAVQAEVHTPGLFLFFYLDNSKG